MKTVYLRHKISPGEIHNLSDKESEILLSQNSVGLEDPMTVFAPNGEFTAMVVHISKASIEVEILEHIDKKTIQMSRIIILQSVLNNSRMAYSIEKSIELGVDEIVPITPHYSEYNQSDIRKMQNSWQKVISNAKAQSLTTQEFTLSKPMNLYDLSSSFHPNSLKICLVTENIPTTSLSTLIKSENLNKDTDFMIAVGPVKGWHSDDIESFKNNDFHFVNMGNLVLRSETAGIVAAAGIKFYQDRI